LSWFEANGTALKQRILLFVPVAIMGATYIGWELVCRLIFGHTPSEARGDYWHHGFNFNPFAPGFMVNQAPLLVAGAVLGILVLVSTFSRNEESRKLEASQFARVDTQALIAVGAATFILLGLFNEPISVLRYTGTAFPLFAVMLLRVPTSKLLPLAAFGVATGMVASHMITTFVIFSTNPPIPSFMPLDLVLCTAFTITFIGTSIALYLRRHVAKSDNAFMLAHLLLAILVVPLSLYFP
jgi:hypothetical protein